MVTQEEIRAKLSLDTSVLGRARRDISEFSKTGESGFVHVAKSAREYHHLVRKIGEANPFLGMLLTFNPIAAAMQGFNKALEWGLEKLKEWNAEMDKTEARNATAIFGADAMQSAATELHKMRSEHEKFMDSRVDASKLFMDALEQEQQKLQDNLDIEKQRLTLNKQLASEMIRQQVSRGTMSMSAGMAALNQLGTSSAQGERAAQSSSLGKRQASLETQAGQAGAERDVAQLDLVTIERLREENLAKLRKQQGEVENRKGALSGAEEHEKKIKGMSQTDLAWYRSLTGDKGSVNKYNAEAEEGQKVAAAKRELEDKKKMVADLQAKQDDLNASYDETKEKVTKWGTNLETVNKQTAKIKEEQQKLSHTPLSAGGQMSLSSPNEFSTSELGQYNTWYGRVAREIESRKRWSKYYSAAGRDDLARQVNKSIDPNGGKDSLYGLLPAGLTSEQNAASRQTAMINQMIAALNSSGDGVPVKVTSIPNG